MWNSRRFRWASSPNTVFAVQRRLTAGVLTAGAMLSIAPAALAAPVPDPGVPVPAPVQSDSGGCQGGEVMQDGNCVPAMTSVASTAGGDADPADTPLRYTESQTTTIQSGLPVDLVPNINGESCTGYWQSGACYAQNFNTGPAVVPRSTLSTSP